MLSAVPESSFSDPNLRTPMNGWSPTSRSRHTSSASEKVSEGGVRSTWPFRSSSGAAYSAVITRHGKRSPVCGASNCIESQSRNVRYPFRLTTTLACDTSPSTKSRSCSAAARQARLRETPTRKRQLISCIARRRWGVLNSTPSGKKSGSPTRRMA